MARKRFNVYMDADLHKNVMALLDAAPGSRTSLSSLVEGLLSDWYSQVHLAPKLEHASSEERRAIVNEMAVSQFLELAEEVRLTRHKIPPGKESES